MKGLTLNQREQARLEVLNRVLQGLVLVKDAAHTLGVSERQAWRLLAAYRRKGAAALAHGNRGQRPANATLQEVRERVINLARGPCAGLNQMHFTEVLSQREGIRLARTTVRNILMGAGVPSPRRRRPPLHRTRRQRMPQEGMLLQLDGSYHAWLEERGPWLTLLLAVDDATGTVPLALFQEGEDTRGYLLVLRGIVQQHGIPLAVYTDRHAVFLPRRGGTDGPLTAAESARSQVARALRELGITQIFARSPEAKGRVERANGTFQDRLVSELRMAGAATLDDANRVLAGFLPQFNARFGVPAAQPGPAYRQPAERFDVDGILCFKERRQVARDNTVQYHDRTLQLFPSLERPSYARACVEVQERLDGRVLVSYQGTLLTPTDAPPLAKTLRARAVAYQEAARQAPGFVEGDASERSLKQRVAARVKATFDWEAEWYDNPERKRVHRDLVRAGMERARQRGTRIGRPKVSERHGFAEQFADVVTRLAAGSLSGRQAAEELEIGSATLKRLLDARPGDKGSCNGAVDSIDGGLPSTLSTASHGALTHHVVSDRIAEQ